MLKAHCPIQGPPLELIPLTCLCLFLGHRPEPSGLLLLLHLLDDPEVSSRGGSFSLEAAEREGWRTQISLGQGRALTKKN